MIRQKSKPSRSVAVWSLEPPPTATVRRPSSVVVVIAAAMGFRRVATEHDNLAARGRV